MKYLISVLALMLILIYFELSRTEVLLESEAALTKTTEDRSAPLDVSWGDMGYKLVCIDGLKYASAKFKNTTGYYKLVPIHTTGDTRYQAICYGD